MNVFKLLAISASFAIAASASQAAVVQAYNQGGFSASATIEDAGVNRVLVTLEVDTSTGILGDIRGWFFDSSTFVLDLVDISGDFSRGMRDTSDLGGGNNVNPLGPFDVGLEFGSPGIGFDDIQSTSFYLLGVGLSEASFFGQASALRVTSVGPEGGDRGGSLKIPGTPPSEVPLPASGLLILAGLGGLALMRKRS